MLLTEEQKQFYKENGYLLVKNVFTEEELKEIETEYENLFRRQNLDNMESAWVGSDENDRKHDGIYTIKGIHTLPYHHAVFTKFLLNDKLLDVLEGVMGTPNIALHHTKANVKPPEKGAAFPMHQDYHYFPFEKDSLVAAFLHLDPANPENGGLFVYPGSHKLGPQEDVGAREGNFHYLDQTKWTFEGATPVIADRGDLIVFSYLLVHGSPINASNRTRRMLLVEVTAADDRPIGEQKLTLEQGMLLRGCNFKRDARVNKRFNVY